MTAEPYCFCELAPLYALDLLSQIERQWVEQQLVECPELAAELAQYEAAVTTIPYSAPLTPMAGNLKQRLFDRLELGDANLGDAELEATESALSSAPSEAKLSPFLTVRSQDVQWQPHPVPGVETAIFYSNPVKREIVGLLRASAGCRYPFHRHAATEDLYMLEGELVIGDEIYGVGDYIHSEPGTAHAPYTTTGCTFFFHTSMDDEYPQVATAESV